MKSEFDGMPAEINQLKSQAAMAIVRRVEQTGDKNKRDIAQLREKLAAFPPVDIVRSELVELEKNVSQTKSFFDQENQINLDVIQKANNIRRNNTSIRNEMQDSVEPFSESMKSQIEQTFDWEKKTRQDLARANQELRAYIEVVASLPDYQTAEPDPQQLAEQEAKSACLESRRTREQQEAAMVMEELHCQETSRLALEVDKTKTVGDNQAKLDVLLVERATTLKALQEEIANLKIKRAEALAALQDEIANLKMKRAETLGALQEEEIAKKIKRATMLKALQEEEIAKMKIKQRRVSFATSPPKKAKPNRAAQSQPNRFAQSQPNPPVQSQPNPPAQSPPRKAKPNRPAQSPPKKAKPNRPVQSPPKKTKPNRPAQSPPKKVKPNRHTQSPPKKAKQSRSTSRALPGRTTAADIFDIFAFGDDED